MSLICFFSGHKFFREEARHTPAECGCRPEVRHNRASIQCSTPSHLLCSSSNNWATGTLSVFPTAALRRLNAPRGGRDQYRSTARQPGWWPAPLPSCSKAAGLALVHLTTAPAFSGEKLWTVDIVLWSQFWGSCATFLQLRRTEHSHAKLESH